MWSDHLAFSPHFGIERSLAGMSAFVVDRSPLSRDAQCTLFVVAAQGLPA